MESTRLVVLAMLAACGKGGSSPPEVYKGSNVRELCERYLAHVDQITKYKAPGEYNDAELAFCHDQHTDDQLRCALAATDVDELNLCEQIPDPAQRTLARKLQPSIKAKWPGSAPLMAILTTTSGCGNAGIATRAHEVLSSTQASVVFALREAGATGDATNVVVTLERTGDDWRCIETEPPNMCDAISSACRR